MRPAWTQETVWVPVAGSAVRAASYNQNGAMPVILQHQVVLDRPKWAIQGLMDRVLHHPEREALPAAWRDTLQFHLMISSDLLDLDPLATVELMAFGQIVGDTITAFEAGQAMHDETSRPAFLETLRAVESAVADALRALAVRSGRQA